MKYIILSFVFSIMFSEISMAWDGYNYENGHNIEIEKNNLVRRNNDIEIYDWNTNQYYDVTIENIQENTNGVEIEVYNWDTNQYETYEMEDE